LHEPGHPDAAVDADGATDDEDDAAGEVVEQCLQRRRRKVEIVVVAVRSSEPEQPLGTQMLQLKLAGSPQLSVKTLHRELWFSSSVNFDQCAETSIFLKR